MLPSKQGIQTWWKSKAAPLCCGPIRLKLNHRAYKGAEEGCRVDTKPSSNDGRGLLDDVIASSILNV